MATQPRIPAGDKRRGRIHPGEFQADPPKRRGKKGSPVPKSAAIHDRKVSYPSKGNPRHDPSGGNLPQEMVGGFTCKSCGYQGWREHRVVTKEGAQHATLALIGCTNCGTMHPGQVGATDRALQANRELKRMAAKAKRVGKTVDTGETALLPGDGGGDLVGHRRACPRGGDSACGKEIAGRCSLCDVSVRDHEALGKADAAVLDLMKLAGLA